MSSLGILFNGLDRIEWGQFSDAYGPASDFPDNLRRAIDPDPELSEAYVRHLWSSVWHQGTVYSVSPVAVPFLCQVVCSTSVPDSTRTWIAFLIAEIADPATFELDDEMVHHTVPWKRPLSEPPPKRELSEECRRAVVAVSDGLFTELANSSEIGQSGLVAIGAKIAADLDEVAIRQLTAVMGSHPDADVRLAAHLILELSRGNRSGVQSILATIEQDEDVSFELSNFDLPDMPIERRASVAAHTLCMRYANKHLA